MNTSYLAQFSQALLQIQPNKEKLVVEDYFTTFAALPPPLVKSEKCAIKAEIVRNVGNKIFMIRKYEDAVIIYTDSLRIAPPYSKCAALAYANRSAALYHLEAYEECVLDIDRALDLPYPNDLRKKIISRKEAAGANINRSTNQTNNHTAVDDLKFAHGQNTKILGASRGIDIAYNLQDGRKLVAKLAFQAGDVLLVQNPFLPVQKFGQHPAYCHYCWKKSLCLIPCDKCIYDVYCSKKCQSQAYESYHRIECKIQSTLICSSSVMDIQSLMYQLRCLTVLTKQGDNLDALYDDFMEIEQNSNPAKLGFTDEQFIANSGKALISSLSGKKIEHNTALFDVCYIVVLLRNFTNFFKTNGDIPVVAKLLDKLDMAYSLNCIRIPCNKTDTVIGSGTYPLLGLANHACAPNTITYYSDDGRLVLRASQVIRPGDQISFTYDELIWNITEFCHENEQLYQWTRACRKCAKTSIYPPKKYRPIKINKKLRLILQRNPHNITGLWKLLNIVQEQHQSEALQVEVIKRILISAHEGLSDSTDKSAKMLRLFGIC